MYLKLLFLFLPISIYSQSSTLSEKFENNVFQVNYPKGWRVHTQSALHELVLYPPSLGDEYETSINFFEMKEENPITDISKYAIKAKHRMQIRTDIQSSSILDSPNGKYIRYDFTMDFYGTKLTGIQFRFIKGTTVYSISFSGEDKSYANYKKVAEDVMASFRYK